MYGVEAEIPNDSHGRALLVGIISFVVGLGDVQFFTAVLYISRVINCAVTLGRDV